MNGSKQKDSSREAACRCMGNVLAIGLSILVRINVLI
jgi:hypothetical protein